MPSPSASAASSPAVAPGERSFPALDALTRHFTVGEPRSFSLAADGTAVYFLRSKEPGDPCLHLWGVDLTAEDPQERLVVDVADILGSSAEDVPEAERQRRERLRETSAGITAFSCDDGHRVVAFALSGALYLADLHGDAGARRLGDDVGVVDPRLDPTGQRVAYVAGSTLRVADVATGRVTVVAEAPEDAQVGLADFVAAEEFDRTRGHWWSPDGTSLAYETVDDSALEEVWLFDPATPQRPASSRRYPRAGGANPLVGMRISRLDGSTVEVAWDKGRYPYLVTASWPAHAPLAGPLLTLMTRDQRDQVVAAVDGESGEITVVYEASDDGFLEWVDGLPTYASEGRLVVGVVDRGSDTYRLAVVDGSTATPFTPSGLQVRDVVAVGEAGLIVNASTDPRGLVIAEVSFDGGVNVIGDESARTRALAGASGVIVVTTSDALDTSVAFVVRRGTASPVVLRSLAWDPADALPPVRPALHFLEAGPHALSVAVLFPREMPEDGRRLPIILSPYGGPHHQRVVSALRTYALDQYLADQGYCVVVADGRGTGGRGPAWDRSVVGDLGDAPVEDQVTALEAVCAAFGDRVDPGRVGVRGWSFGGYLAARCVLTRPDVFHAAVAGAPVTEWRWYDTGYTERYLGHPDEAPATYAACSLLALAPRLERPLFFIHGYSDDNVLFCHTQMLSNALTEAGRPHRVVGLSGVTHMATDPKVAESLLRMQVEFFNETLR